LLTLPTLLFRVGATLYGCDVRDAREILPLRAATRLPGSAVYVRGLINVRGTIVTVIDLGARLDPARAPARAGSILLVRRRDRLVGLIVDSVADVRPLDVDESIGEESGGAIVRGLASLGGAPVVVLDLDALIAQVLLS
jgi:purine-binding chemotaxis protein CheW